MDFRLPAPRLRKVRCSAAFARLRELGCHRLTLNLTACCPNSRVVRGSPQPGVRWIAPDRGLL